MFGSIGPRFGVPSGRRGAGGYGLGGSVGSGLTWAVATAPISDTATTERAPMNRAAGISFTASLLAWHTSTSDVDLGASGLQGPMGLRPGAAGDTHFMAERRAAAADQCCRPSFQRKRRTSTDNLIAIAPTRDSGLAPTVRSEGPALHRTDKRQETRTDYRQSDSGGVT